MLPKKLFAIQIEFAKKSSELDKIPLEESLLKHTAFYRIFFVSSEVFDDTQETWKNYLKYIANKDIVDATYEYYKQNLIDRKVIDREKYTGKPCFIYELKDNYIKLHFNNNEAAEPGPLSNDRITNRTNELKAIFTEIKEKYPEVKTVKGTSWLYNIDTYKRLFPDAYISSAENMQERFQSLDIWGQFLDSSLEMKGDLMKEFLNKVKNAENIKDLFESFPLTTLKVEADITEFYKKYDIS